MAAADLDWAALLAHWTAFARSSLALPRGAEGDRWRAAVAPIIGLQAVTFALGDLGRLRESDDERALALDRAEVLIRRHADELAAIWPGQALHPELTAIVADARAALAAAVHGGLEWTVAGDRIVAPHPADLLESLAAMGFAGDLYLPVPGVPVFRSCPVAFARGAHGGPPPGTVAEAITRFLAGAGEVDGPAPVAQPRQVCRQFDFGRGGPVRDVVVPMDGPPPPGQPLLVAAMRRGEPQAVPLPIRGADDVPALPVVFAPSGC
jgi:hypothetical protein